MCIHTIYNIAVERVWGVFNTRSHNERTDKYNGYMCLWEIHAKIETVGRQREREVDKERERERWKRLY